MATIKISDSPHPRDKLQQTESSDGASSSIADPKVNSIYRPSLGRLTETPHDNIYNIRSRSSLSRPSLDRLNSTSDSRERDDEDPGLGRPGDFKHRQVSELCAMNEHRQTKRLYCQVFKGRVLAWLAYQSLGVIYGDIGTSPLYVYSSTFTSAPSRRDLIGVLSIIIWSLIMMVTVKYIIVILRADNDGEGGTFSTYSLLSRYVR